MSEALRLADAMTHYFDERGPDAEEVAAELRRLHALNAELVEALRSVVAWMDAPDESAFSDTQLAAARAALAKVEASK